MGNTKSKETTLKLSELNEFHNMTLFSNEILIKLYDHYRHFSSIQTDDGVIDYDEFCLLIGKNDKNLTKRIFDSIDVNKDGSINFREFVKFISCFQNGSFEEQMNLSFKMFSNSDTKIIEEEMMISLLKDVILAEDSLSKFFNNDLINIIVKETFNKICTDGERTINFEKYKEMVRKYPDILNWLKVDLDRIKKVKVETKLKKKWCG